MRLNVKAFALACGILWGAGMFLITWWLLILEGPGADMSFIAMFYRGYRVSPLGSVIGLVWGFFDGLIGGALFAWLYNRLAGKAGAQAAGPVEESGSITP